MADETKKTILLVEDEVITAMMGKTQLEKYGYCIHHVTTGEEAVQSILDNVLHVDLILMDINLGSGIDGTKAAEQILNHKDIPVVFLSSHTDPEIVEKTEKITSYGYVVKNSGIVVLDASIKMALKLFKANMLVEKNKIKAEQNEYKYRILADNTPDFIYSFDLDSRHTMVNDSVCKAMNLEYKDIIGKNHIELGFSKEIADEWRKLHLKVINNKETIKMETSTPMPDGTFRTYEIILSPIVDDIGNISGVRGISRDISDRKTVEKALRGSETRFRGIYENGPLGIALGDLQGRLTMANPSFCKIVGYEEKELLGKNFREFTVDDDLPAENALIEEMIAGKRNHYNIEKRYIRKDGRHIWILLYTSVFKDIEGKPEFGLVMAQDITDRKQAENELVESEMRFRIAQEMSPDGFTILHPVRNEKGKIIDFTWIFENSTIAHINGTDPEKIIGKRLLEIFPDHRDTPVFEAYLHVANTGETRVIEEISVENILSKPMWLRLVVVSMGKDIAVLAQVITERKLSEQLLKTHIDTITRLNKLSTLYLHGNNMESIFNEIVDTAIAITEADFGNIQILDEKTSDLKIMAQKNFPKWWIEFWETVSKGKGTCGTALERRERVIIEDVEQSSIFYGTPSLDVQLRAGVRAVQSTPLISRTGKIIGMFSTHYRTPKRPSEVTIQLLDILARFVADIIDHKRMDDEIQKQLTEKDILLEEVHHRVKNNIVNIESLLILQSESTSFPEVKTALQDAIYRVQSMRILYENLFLSKDFHEISIKGYIENLIDSLLAVFVSKNNITIEKRIADFNIISKKAVSIGIIINELLTNVFKYAFNNCENGRVLISIEKIENNVTLIVKDNGIGINKTIEKNKSHGFDLTIVKILVEQLEGTHNIVNENGTKTIIQFEL